MEEHSSEGEGRKLRPVECSTPESGPPDRKRGGKKRANLQVGAHTVEIPDDALDQDEDFEMSAMPPGRIGIEVGARGKQEVRFKKKVTIVLSYRGCPKPKGAGRYTMARVGDNGRLEEVPGATDHPGQMTVTARVDSFSGYLVAT